jgi:hypothetical protein
VANDGAGRGLRHSASLETSRDARGESSVAATLEDRVLRRRNLGGLLRLHVQVRILCDKKQRINTKTVKRTHITLRRRR